MTCTRTGCDILIEPHGLYAHGDAFDLDGITIFRLVSTTRKPSVRIHYTIHDWAYWFDQGAQVSTLITNQYENHGYQGKETKEAAE